MMTIIESAEWISSDELCTAIPFRSQPRDHSDSTDSQSDMPRGLWRDSLILGLLLTT